MEDQRISPYGDQVRLVAKFFYSAMERRFPVRVIGEVDGVACGVVLDTKDPHIRKIFEDFCQGLNAVGLMFQEGMLKNAPTDALQPEISSQKTRHPLEIDGCLRSAKGLI